MITSDTGVPAGAAPAAVSRSDRTAAGSSGSAGASTRGISAAKVVKWPTWTVIVWVWLLTSPPISTQTFCLVSK